MKSCEELRERWIVDKIEERTAENDEHFRGCADCSAWLERTEKLHQLVQISFNDESFSPPSYQVIDNRIKKATRQRLVILASLASAAAAIIMGLSTLFSGGRGNEPITRPFEHVFSNNGGFIRASDGSSIRKIDEKTFRLDKGSLVVQLRSKNVAAIQTDQALIQVSAHDADGDIDFEVKLQEKVNDKLKQVTVIMVSTGTLLIASPHSAFGKLTVMAGDVVTITGNVASVKTIKLLREGKIFKDLYGRDPAFVESFNESEKTEWASMVGKKLKERIGFLTTDEKVKLATILLKEQKIVDRLVHMAKKQEEPVVDEGWFYIGSLRNDDPLIHHAAALLTREIAVNMHESLVEEAAFLLVTRVDVEDVTVCFDAAYTLGEISKYIKKEKLHAIIKELSVKLKNKNPIVISSIAASMEIISQNLDSAQLEELVKNMLNKLDDKEIMIPIGYVNPVVQVMIKLQGESFERSVKSLVKKFENEEDNIRYNGAFLLKGLALNIKGTLLDNVTEAAEKALEKEQVPVVKKQLEAAVLALKK